MRKIEYILLTIFSLGFFLRVAFSQKIGIAAMLLIGSLYAIVLMYFCFGWYIFKDRVFKNGHLVISIFAGWFLSISVLGIVYKIMIWNGGQNMLILSANNIEMAMLSALAFWKDADCNSEADGTDDDSIQEVTFRINGGTNGWDNRKNFTIKAYNILTPN